MHILKLAESQGGGGSGERGRTGRDYGSGLLFLLREGKGAWAWSGVHSCKGTVLKGKGRGLKIRERRHQICNSYQVLRFQVVLRL